jgi:uncharacterized OB-fold protein
MTQPAIAPADPALAAEPHYVAPGLVTRDGEGHPRLVGGRCRACGAESFPKAAVCPQCLAEEIEGVMLSRDGTLYSFAAVHAAPPGWHLPYVLGYVDLPEGVRVLAHLAAKEEDLRVDMPVRLAVGEVGSDPSGQPLFTYVFAPRA